MRKLQTSLNFDAFMVVYVQNFHLKFNGCSYLRNKSVTSPFHALANVLNVK